MKLTKYIITLLLITCAATSGSAQPQSEDAPPSLHEPIGVSEEFDAETAETLNAAGIDTGEAEETAPVATPEPTPVLAEEQPDEEMEPFDPRPYGQGDMDLGIGLGGAGGAGSFTLGIGAMFVYYVLPRTGVGIDLSYQATWGDYKYPQSFTVFPLVKFVLVRSHRFAPYLLTGGGREFEWGGAKRSVDPVTGEFLGYTAVSSWLYGVGGGAAIAIGSRSTLNVQVLAMYQHFDEKIYLDKKWVINRWYPAPSFMLNLRF
jgi:hypothetical protein